MRTQSGIQISAVNAGARLDRLPICGFHWRILGLIGAGMFLDAFDIYLAGGVLGAALKEGTSSLNSPRHLPDTSIDICERPVALPPRRARLSTSPLPTGSGSRTNTIGIVLVAACPPLRPAR